jgi:hypothetical protein
MSRTPPEPPPLPLPGQPFIPPRPDLAPGAQGVAYELPGSPPDRWGIGPGDSHPKATWRWWEAILVFLLGVFVAGIVGAVLAEVLAVGEDGQFFIFAIAGQVIPFAILIGWLQFFHKSWLRVVGWPSKVWPELRAGVLGGLAVYGICALGIGTVLTVIFGLFSDGPVQTPEQLPPDMGPLEIGVAAFMVIVGAPVVEELFFRGVFFRSLRARHSFWFAGAFSSLLFGFAHMSVEEGSGMQGALLLVILMFFVGFGFAYIHERRGNILANTVAHATFNTVGLALILLFS